MTNNFISFEGIEGSGKTTQTEIFNQNYKNIKTTREIGGTRVGEEIRKIILNNKISEECRDTLIFTARLEHLRKKIKPNLEKNKTVICDRYIDSTFVYKETLTISIYQANDNFMRKHKILGKITPDLTILFDIDPEIALQRIKERKEKENIQYKNQLKEKNLQYYHKLRERYLICKELHPSRIKKIKIREETTKEEVHNKILKYMEQYSVNLKK